MILSWNDSGCTRFRNIWISFCMWRVWANWYTCSTNCTSRTAKFGFSSNPCSFHTSSNFAIQLSDGSGFETPTQNVESENTWIFVLIFFLARKFGNVSREQRNVLHSCSTSHMACILGFDHGLHVSLHGLYQILCSWETLLQCHSLELLDLRIGSKSPFWTGNYGGQLGLYQKNSEMLCNTVEWNYHFLMLLSPSLGWLRINFTLPENHGSISSGFWPFGAWRWSSRCCGELIV